MSVAVDWEPLEAAVSVILDHRGMTPKKLGSEFVPYGIPVASAMLVKDGLIDLTDARFVNDETYQKWMPEPLQKGDVILTSEAPLGRVAQVDTNSPLVLGQRLFALRGRSGHLDSRYLYYALQSSRVSNDIQSRATGTTVLGIRQSALRQVKLPIRPICVQQAIAEVLGALDDKIAANRKLVTTAESYLRAIFDRDLASNDLPTSPLDSIVQLNPKRPAPKDPAPLIPMQALPTPGITIPEFTRDTPKGGVRFTNGDTLLARITPCLENGKTAFVGSLAEGEIGIGSTEYIVLRSIEPYPLEVSYFIATDATFRAEAIRRMTGTSGRQRVKAQDVAKVPIHLTSDRAAMRQFGDLARSCFQHAEILSAESRTLASLRDTLLPALMDGTIRVKDAETHVEEVL
ncbi:EcoKI restriction-modification system protein HsdS [Acidipropionibacterium jensenii]|uniref:EcoKI restriction-modification system protein HsdS n=1 Tax=Acidipropionibacterium jensenii TaxID=1749 RepID=A0A448P2X2_9ACTN|nr:restriction endonuclease subunit S [Acidipropionibacterium jensenii]QCV87323.1 restriction endonuclease subunit S [Acidipropionibacterium jensenii]VEI04556.1 EcoKI restriction-modification system protein HsdS [Acidipropionibacterium jensenii]